MVQQKDGDRMSRVDKPTLKCDRCAQQTQSLTEMARFRTLDHHYMSGKESWDLCPECWARFIYFIEEEK